MLDKKLKNNKLTCYDLIKEIPSMHKEYEFLKEVDSMSLRCAVFDLDNGFKKYYRKQVDEILKKYKHIDKLNRVIVDEFIDKVYVGVFNKETKTRDIEIEWNIEF